MIINMLFSNLTAINPFQPNPIQSNPLTQQYGVVWSLRSFHIRYDRHNPIRSAHLWSGDWIDDVYSQMDLHVEIQRSTGHVRMV